jgi:hypothetical protein
LIIEINFKLFNGKSVVYNDYNFQITCLKDLLRKVVPTKELTLILLIINGKTIPFFVSSLEVFVGTSSKNKPIYIR